MSAPRITTEAVEAAAKAIYETPHDGLSRQGYDRAPRDIQKLYLAEAEAALEAALPHLAPQPVDREAIVRILELYGVSHDALTPDLARSTIAVTVLALINGSQANG